MGAVYRTTAGSQEGPRWRVTQPGGTPNASAPVSFFQKLALRTSDVGSVSFSYQILSVSRSTRVRSKCVNVPLSHRKHDNHWFYGEPWSLDGSDEPTPAVLADDRIRERVLAFFRSLPLRKPLRTVLMRIRIDVLAAQTHRQ